MTHHRFFSSTQLCLLLLLLSFVALHGVAQPTQCDPDPGTDMTIEYGDQIACNISPAGDKDFFSFFASAGDIPLITMKQSGSSYRNNPCIAIYDDTGTLIEEDCGTDSFADLQPMLTKEGTYRIVAADRGNDYGSTYSLELSCFVGKCLEAAPRTLHGYTPVKPCRIVDTRYGIGGAFSAGETRHYKSYGNVTEQNKAAGGAPGNYPDTCPFDLGEHGAAQLNITVVPQDAFGTGGFITAWPFGGTRPNTSIVNYKAGAQNIANAAVIPTHESDAATADFSVYSLRNAHVIIDVMGYMTR